MLRNKNWWLLYQVFISFNLIKVDLLLIFRVWCYYLLLYITAFRLGLRKALCWKAEWSATCTLPWNKPEWAFQRWEVELSVLSMTLVQSFSTSHTGCWATINTFFPNEQVEDKCFTGLHRNQTIQIEILYPFSYNAGFSLVSYLNINSVFTQFFFFPFLSLLCSF